MNWELIGDILLATVPLLVIFPSMFALTTWVERKALARIQNRIGPNKVGVPLTPYGGKLSLFGLGQPAADGIKMLFKENIVPTGADRLFHLLAPILSLIPAMLVLCFLPLEFPWLNGRVHGRLGLAKQIFLAGRHASHRTNGQLRNPVGPFCSGRGDDRGQP
jgi:NADH:ubiquinone oxidoreductase subunit H